MPFQVGHLAHGHDLLGSLCPGFLSGSLVGMALGSDIRVLTVCCCRAQLSPGPPDEGPEGPVRNFQDSTYV